MNKDRYARNILLPEIGKEGQEKINQLKVFVAGAGGLASSVITNLACLGVENIGIIDFDVVEISNLNRQFIHKEASIGQLKTESAKNWITTFNSNINVKTYPEKLSKDNTFISEYDIAVDCFDNWESKFLLNKIAINTNIPLIHAGAECYRGQIITIIPHQTACLGCILESTDAPKVNKGIIAPVVNVIGSMAANEVINFALKNQLLTNNILSYDINKRVIKTTQIARNNKCKICSKE